MDGLGAEQGARREAAEDLTGARDAGHSLAALTATETGHRTLDSLDDLHTTRTEAIDLKAIEAAQERKAQKEAAGR